MNVRLARRASGAGTDGGLGVGRQSDAALQAGVAAGLTSDPQNQKIRRSSFPSI
jgi:hypothetical protein